MFRLAGRSLVSVMIIAVASATAFAQPEQKPPAQRAPAPAPAKLMPPQPLPMGWANYPPSNPFVPYPGMPVYSWAQWQGMAPPQPLTYPFSGFVAGYPYPGYAMVYPYPRTVSSYSSGPSLRPPMGRVGGGWGWR